MADVGTGKIKTTCVNNLKSHTTTILNRLPMRCSASNKFANGNVNSCACVLRKSIYSLMTRIHALALQYFLTTFQMITIYF